MNDLLLESLAARKVIKTLGLPLPLPTPLKRADGPMQARPLHDRAIAVGGASELSSELATMLARAGASPHLSIESLAGPFAEPGEAYGRPATRLDLANVDERLKLDGLVFDGSGIADPGALRWVYEFFHPLIRKVRHNGRVVVIGRPPRAMSDATAAASQAALEGLMRSLAKELGKRGSTATLLRVEPGAEPRLEGPLRFALSRRCAFVTGQPMLVTAEAKAPSATPWTRPLEGKVALVTGAARGIGAATASLLADEGAHVVCLDRPADDGPVAKVAHAIGGSVLLADVAEASSPDVIASHLVQHHGGVDIVVHNAGVTRDKTMGRMKPEQWDLTLDINLRAVLAMQDALIGRHVLRDEGRIIALSSVSGLAGNVGQTNYAASKAGLAGYVRAIAPSLAFRGITANAVAPGFIETRMTAAMPMTIREAARRLSSLGQGGTPRDVGDAITFLATPGASGITGQVLRVCGGAFIGA